MDAARAFFIQGKKFEVVLNDHHQVGAHTDIYLLEPGSSRRFIWSHPGRRPFGNPIPLQCIMCKSLRSWGPPDVKCTSPARISSITLTCQYCNHFLTEAIPEGFVKFSKGKLDSTERGEWYVERLE